MKKIFIITAFLFLTFTGYSQELICNVSIVSSQIQGTNKQVFQTLQKAIYEFMNNRTWTSNVFENEERIECNMLFNLKEKVGTDEYKGTLQIQSRRPVFNSSYNSVLFNYIDNDLDIRYVEFQPLDFNENIYQSGLTSILAYYAYIILGLDYDSYSLEGGTEYFQKAERIVTNAQNASESGWRASDSRTRRNRYWLVENILNEDYAPVREFIYKYHRLGLDRMDAQTGIARADMVEDLKLLQKIKREKPDPYMQFLQVIFDAKSDEFVNVFSQSPQDEKSRVLQLLIEIDPSNKSKYEKITK
jgi:hypothetical protein